MKRSLQKVLLINALSIGFAFQINSALSMSSPSEKIFHQFLSEHFFLANSDHEIVVTFEDLEIKQYEAFDQRLAQLSGLTKTGFCQKLNCYYFSYDTNMYASAADAFASLEMKMKEYRPLYKEGTNSGQVNKACENL